MVQSVSFLANSFTLGTGSSVITLGADSGRLVGQDSQGTGISVGGATIYANNSSLPTSGLSAGEMAFSSGNNTLFISNGSGWYRIALLNETPTVSATSDYIIGSSMVIPPSSTVDIPFTISDPEGFPVTTTVSNTGIANTSIAEFTYTDANTTLSVTTGSTLITSGAATLTLSSTDSINITLTQYDFSIGNVYISTPDGQSGDNTGIAQITSMGTTTDNELKNDTAWTITGDNSSEYVRWDITNMGGTPTLSSGDKRVVWAWKGLDWGGIDIGWGWTDKDGNRLNIHTYSGKYVHVNGNSSYFLNNPLLQNKWYLITPYTDGATVGMMVKNITDGGNPVVVTIGSGAGGYAASYQPTSLMFYGDDAPGITGYLSRGAMEQYVGGVVILDDTYSANVAIDKAQTLLFG